MIKEHHRNWLGNETRANLGNLTKFIASYFKRKSTDKSGYNWNWRYQLELRSVQNQEHIKVTDYWTSDTRPQQPALPTHTRSSLMLGPSLKSFVALSRLHPSCFYFKGQSGRSTIFISFHKLQGLHVCNHLETRVTRLCHVSVLHGRATCQLLHGRATCQCYTAVPRVTRTLVSILMRAGCAGRVTRVARGACNTSSAVPGVAVPCDGTWLRYDIKMQKIKSATQPHTIIEIVCFQFLTTLHR